MMETTLRDMVVQSTKVLVLIKFLKGHPPLAVAMETYQLMLVQTSTGSSKVLLQWVHPQTYTQTVLKVMLQIHLKIIR
ncbi:MAG: hypothetical protein CBC48_17435 [bacterium TMED88]|nr:MAG: hypothetical protein CBC48_17435 [bacterium TMED88]